MASRAANTTASAQDTVILFLASSALIVVITSKPRRPPLAGDAFSVFPANGLFVDEVFSGVLSSNTDPSQPCR